MNSDNEEEVRLEPKSSLREERTVESSKPIETNVKQLSDAQIRQRQKAAEKRSKNAKKRRMLEAFSEIFEDEDVETISQVLRDTMRNTPAAKQTLLTSGKEEHPLIQHSAQAYEMSEQDNQLRNYPYAPAVQVPPLQHYQRYEDARAMPLQQPPYAQTVVYPQQVQRQEVRPLRYLD